MDDDSARSRRRRLSRGGLLARNTTLNIGAQLTIVVLALAAIPILIDELGEARFGLLTIAWVVIGYAGVFDLGLGRALIALVSDRLGTGRDDEVPALFWTALTTMLAAGVVGLAALVVVAPWLIGDMLDVGGGLQGEATTAFVVLAFSLPFVIGSQALRAMLETEQRFDLVNAVQVPSSALSYFGPVLALQFWSGLPAVVAAVVATRIGGFVVLLLLTVRVVPAARERFTTERAALKDLFRFGGWVTLSNLVSPILSNMDRVFVGALVSVSAVTFYATPYEIVRRMWIPSYAVAGVLFPAFALTHSADPARAAKLFGAGNRMIFVVMFPMALIVVAFAHEGLGLWLGSDFADRSDTVMQLLTIGVLANALAQVSFGFVQSTKPALSAFVELAQVPIFVVAIVLLTNAYGIEGAAVAWAGRQALDAAVLHVVSGRLVPAVRPVSRTLGLAAAGALAALAAVAALEGIAVKGLAVVAILAAFAVLAWLILLAEDEKRAMAARLRAAAARAPMLRRWRRAD